MLLRLKSGDEDGRMEILRQIARGDADIPTARAPFGQFVICQRARRDGVDGLATVLAIIGPQFENERFARTCRRLHHHVLP